MKSIKKFVGMVSALMLALGASYALPAMAQQSEVYADGTGSVSARHVKNIADANSLYAAVVVEATYTANCLLTDGRNKRIRSDETLTAEAGAVAVYGAGSVDSFTLTGWNGTPVVNGTPLLEGSGCLVFINQQELGGVTTNVNVQYDTKVRVYDAGKEIENANAEYYP